MVSVEKDGAALDGAAEAVERAEEEVKAVVALAEEATCKAPDWPSSCSCSEQLEKVEVG